MVSFKNVIITRNNDEIIVIRRCFICLQLSILQLRLTAVFAEEVGNFTFGLI